MRWLLLLLPAAVATTAGMAMVCAIAEGVILPGIRGRATRKRLQALKSNRKPWPTWLAWLHV